MKNKETFYVLYPFVANFGGIERLIVDLARYLDANGKTLELLAFQNHINFADYGAQNLAVHTISSPRRLRSEARALKAHILERGIPSSRILAMEMRGAIYAGMALVPGYSIHIADPPSLLPSDLSKYSFSLARNYKNLQNGSSLAKRFRGQIVHGLTKRGVCRARRAVTMTQRNVDELFAAYGVKFEAVPPGVRLPELVQRKNQDLGTVRFLSVCRLEPSKRIDSIIRCLANLVAENHNFPHTEFRLKIVGEGSQSQQLKDLARDCKIDSLVEFTGLVSDEELERIYAESDVFVMPAIQGYGLPGLESLGRGLQLIVHRESGVTEFLTNTPNVQIIDNFDTSLTWAMKQAAKSIDQSTDSRPTVPSSNEWAARLVQISGW